MPRIAFLANNLSRPQRAVFPPLPPKQAAAPSAFDQLCESIKDLPPKGQARRMEQHFGAFGGARPTKAPFGPAFRKAGPELGLRQPRQGG
jgi:hypothetical protein